MKHPDSHYLAVVEVFVEAIEGRWPISSKGHVKPGAAVAETWGVPLTTAHRWIREARKRGLLLQRFNSYLPCNHRCPLHCHDD